MFFQFETFCCYSNCTRILRAILNKSWMLIYSKYHAITDACTTAWIPTKPSSNDDSGFRHGFGAEASLPLAQSAPAVSHDTTRLCQIVVTLWDCHIHADAVRALSWIFSMYYLLSDGGSRRLVKKTEGELAIKSLHPTSIGNTFVIQPFLTHCSHRSSYFSDVRWCAQSKFSSKWAVNSITKKIFCFRRPNDHIWMLWRWRYFVYIHIYIYI